MIPCQFSLYLGRENEKGFADFIAEDLFYCVVEIEDGFTKEQGKDFIADLKQRSQRPLESLYALDLLITDAIKHANIPASFSLAVMYRKGDMVYLKTAGAGEIFLNREGEFAKIIHGDNSASGYVKEGDFFILTTSRFTHLIGHEKDFKHVFSSDRLENNIESLSAKLENQDNQGTIAQFLILRNQPTHAVAVTEVAQDEQENNEHKEKSPRTPFLSQIKQKIKALQEKSKDSPARQLITKIAVVIVLLILVWSVVLGVKRRSESEIYKKIQSSQEIIDHKLAQAQTVAPLNVPSAITLINQAKEELKNLKSAVGKRDIKEVNDLEAKISAEEQLITKKQEKSFNEFFDLTVDSKNATGDKMYLDGEDLVVLDKKRSIVYVLSLTQKSLSDRSASGIKQTSLITKNQDMVYLFIPAAGVYSIDNNNNTKKVIGQDPDWGTIQDVKMFNGNFYFLDSAKNEIDKYIGADNGFGSKISYLKGQSVDLSGSNSLAIDSSVYIGFSDGILKFTSGIADTFKTSFPESGVNISKIYTDENLDKVYAWDKSKGALYILGKDGTYDRQFKSSIFSTATDFVVRGQSAYFLSGAKIYTVSLN